MRENKPTKSIGSEAEHLVANHLIEHGHFILDMNWKTKWCEIDIISKKDNTVFLTEVKYRKISNWGSGLEAITTKKLSQMKFAAELWMASQKWTGSARLMAASVEGQPPRIDQIIEID